MWLPSPAVRKIQPSLVASEPLCEAYAVVDLDPPLRAVHKAAFSE